MKKSAGILVYRKSHGELKMLIIHSNGREDLEAWSIPKGEFDPSIESPEQAAVREVKEELGFTVPKAELVSLGDSVYKNKSKRVYCFGWEAMSEPKLHLDSTEVALAKFCSVEEARAQLHEAQVVFVDRLLDILRPCNP